MFERIREVRNKVAQQSELRRLLRDCRKLLGERGEANSAVIAARVLEHYGKLSDETAAGFFEMLAAEFDPEPARLVELALSYQATRSPQDLVRLFHAVESPRQELLRRLNRAQGGTAAIVAMRARLLEHLRSDPVLTAVDADFSHLLSSWFNPGFLKLVQVDWSSPALLLEKLVMHEAVHQIDGWRDLRRRLEPDRRCFAFFHPTLPDEPLIFVEVALVPEIPAGIAPLIDRDAATDDNERSFKVAVFYSISNCQAGLRGVNLGNFLIKQVAQELHRQIPGIKTFCTLSPIPGFARWLAKLGVIESSALKPAEAKRLNAALDGLRARYGNDPAKWVRAAAPSAAAVEPAEETDATAEPRRISQEKKVLERQAKARAKARQAQLDEDNAALGRLCAFYLCQSASPDFHGADPVARFHLNNGARLERINPRADLSRKGRVESCGFMVNYLYDLGEIEENHEKFVAGEVRASRAVRALL